MDSQSDLGCQDVTIKHRVSFSAFISFSLSPMQRAQKRFGSSI